MIQKLSGLQNFEKELKTGKTFLSRFFAFLFSVALFGSVRAWYTKHYFGYDLAISDGYVQYGLYALALVFVFLSWEKLKKSSFRKHSLGVQLLFFIVALLCFLIPIYSHGSLKSTDLILLEYSIYFLGNLLLFLSFFGVRFFKERLFQLSAFIVMLLPLKLAPLLIDHFWGISSKITMYGLKIIFPLLGVDYTMNMDKFMVSVKAFRAYIGPPCAGIHSLLAFSVLFLFALFLFLERARKISVGKTLFFFFFGLVCVFFLNSLRVAMIILVGAYISPEFAVSTFHNNIGAVLFMIFFILYSTYVLKRIEVK